MKLLTILYVFLFPPMGFYDIEFQSLDDRQISMTDYKGKKILIATIDVGKPSARQFAFLDSLQEVSKDLQIMIIPSSDQSSANEDQVKEFSRATKSTLLVGKSAKLEKRAGESQHKLYQWLTNVENNLHFNNDGEAGRYFLVSAKGTLYATMEPGVPENVILNILKIEFDESQHYIYNPETKLYESQKN